MLGVKLVDWIILCASTAGKSAYMYIEKWVIDKNWERAANFFSRKRERRVSEYARVAGRSSRGVSVIFRGVCAAKSEQKVSSLTQRRLGASPRRRGWETRRRVHRKFRRVSMKKWPKGTACTGVEGAACGVAYIALAVSMNRQRSVHRWISARSFSVCRSELYII